MIFWAICTSWQSRRQSHQNLSALTVDTHWHLHVLNLRNDVKPVSLNTTWFDVFMTFLLLLPSNEKSFSQHIASAHVRRQSFDQYRSNGQHHFTLKKILVVFVDNFLSRKSVEAALGLEAHWNLQPDGAVSLQISSWLTLPVSSIPSVLVCITTRQGVWKYAYKLS